MFADYDRIVSHHGHDAPTNVQETPKPDQPPSQPTEAPAPAPAPAPPNDLFARMEAGDQRLRAKEKQQEDQKHKEQKQRDGFDPWNRQDNAEEKLQHRIANPNGASFQEDEQGLVNAYNDMTSTGVYYDPNTRTEYVKGSVTKRDWLDDFTKVPFWGDTRDSERYQQAESAYNELQTSGHPVDRVVGHSLGGSVALQLQKGQGDP